MLTAIVLFLVGLCLLALGGHTLVTSASALAQRLGLSPFVAGLLLLAFGTSLPELAVNATAFAAGAQELALGNAIGSTLANLGLTLAVAAIAAPLMLRLRLLSPLLVLLILAAAGLVLAGRDGAIGRGEGVALLLAYLAMLGFLVARARHESPSVREGVAAYAAAPRAGLPGTLLQLLVSAALLALGAHLLLRGTLPLGAAWGWSPLLMGLLPVAIGTALPEAAAAIAAARRGQGDMVAGHVIGSSLFNLLVIVGGMAALRPLPLPASFVRLELPAAIVLAALLLPMLRGDLRVSRAEGTVLLVAFAAWIGLELALTLA